MPPWWELVQFRPPSALEAIMIFIFFASIIIAVILLQINTLNKKKKSTKYNIFLYRTRKLGLSNDQSKILIKITKFLNLKDPVELLKQPKLFESSLEKYIKYNEERSRAADNIQLLYKDLVTIYEKIYHPIKFRKQINSIAELDLGQVVYITLENMFTYIAKITKTERNYIALKIIYSSASQQKLKPGVYIKTALWRSGDAEYNFTTEIMEFAQNTIFIAIPQTFDRNQALRPPDKDVNIDCLLYDVSISRPSAESSESADAVDDTMQDFKEELIELKNEEVKEKKIQEEITQKAGPFEGLIFKLNIDETTIRLSDPLSYKNLYYLEFVLSDFKMKILCNIITERTLKKDYTYYYTFRFEDMSSAAKSILTKYITG